MDERERRHARDWCQWEINRGGGCLYATPECADNAITIGRRCEHDVAWSARYAVRAICVGGDDRILIGDDNVGERTFAAVAGAVLVCIGEDNARDFKRLRVRGDGRERRHHRRKNSENRVHGPMLTLTYARVFVLAEYDPPMRAAVRRPVGVQDSTDRTPGTVWRIRRAPPRDRHAPILLAARAHTAS